MSILTKANTPLGCLLDKIPGAVLLLDQSGWLWHANREARLLVGEDIIGAFLERLGTEDLSLPVWIDWTGPKGNPEPLLVRSESMDWLEPGARLLTLHPKRTAPAAADSREFGWAAIAENLDDMVLVVDSGYRVRYANRAAHKGLQAGAGGLIGRLCQELIEGTPTVPAYLEEVKRLTGCGPRVVELATSRLGRALRLTVSAAATGGGDESYWVVRIQEVARKRGDERDAHLQNLALAKSFTGITRALSDLVEGRDPYTAGHSGSVAQLAARIGVEMGLSEEEIEGLRVCAILHDIGKASVPSEILNKPGKLSRHEWGMLQEHPQKAYEALRHIPFPWPVAEVVYQHHERLDGTGYPRGLHAEQIHPWARILAVADVVDAMSKHRPYRPRLPLKVVLEELRRGRSTIYDEQVVDVYMELLRREANRVLVLDDEPLMLDFVKEVLELDGLEVAGFNSPTLALEAFEKAPYPLVVTDLKMPEMDGFEFIKRARMLSPDTEVIVITGSGDKQGAVDALRLGARDFLEKPMEIRMLQTAVREALMHYRGKG